MHIHFFKKGIPVLSNRVLKPDRVSMKAQGLDVLAKGFKGECRGFTSDNQKEGSTIVQVRVVR